MRMAREKVHIETVSSLPPQLDEYLGMMDQFRPHERYDVSAGFGG